MGTAIAWIMLKTGWGEKAARASAYLAVLLLIAAIVGAAIFAIRKDAVDDAQVKVERRAAPATDRAASERASDAIANSKSETEAHNAIHAVPDAAPAAPSHALACKRLHDLGRDPPSCR